MDDALTFEDAAAWESWLAEHHDTAADAWLKIAKKGSGIASVTVSEALDVALCYGWIDSQRKSYDDSTSCSGTRGAGPGAPGPK